MSTTASDLKPVYLIISEQPLLVDQALARLKKRVGEEADLDFNMQVFDVESMAVDDVIAACNTLPFMSDKRLVIVRGVEKLNKEPADALAAYAGNPSETTVLALTGEKLAKNTRLYRAVDALGGLLDRKAKKADLPTHVRRMFEERGKNVEREAVEELIEAVGMDLRRLSVEVDKTAAFVGSRAEVTRADIEDVISTTAPTSVWEFVEALGDRDCARALTLAGYLIGAGESEHGLHALAVRSIRDLIAVRSLLDRGLSSAEGIAREVGRAPWQAKRLVRQAKGFREDELIRLLQDAAASEARMKTSRESRLALERWIIKVCG